MEFLNFVKVMITFSNKTTRENYLYEIEGVRISGDVDYNDKSISASMSITVGADTGYGNINQDGSINIGGLKADTLEVASRSVKAFYEELKSEIATRR